MRVAYAQEFPSIGQASTPALRLGSAAHRVLDRFVREQAFFQEDAEHWVDRLWATELEREREASEQAGELARFGPPQHWPNVELKRARLLKLAGRLRSVLLALPPGSLLETEQALTAYEGRLYGVADLVVRGDLAHKIIDYKTGAVIDRESGEVRDSYRRQLQLYAYLEFATSGTWPETAHLLPLEGRPVDIHVDPAECTALAAEAIDALESFNAVAPGPQPGTPAADICPSCHFAAMCPDFWQRYGEGWETDLLATIGTIERLRSTPLGGISIEVVPRVGFHTDGLTIRNIDPEAFPAINAAGVGASVYAVGLREEPTRGTYRMIPWGALFIDRSALSDGEMDQEL